MPPTLMPLHLHMQTLRNHDVFHDGMHGDSPRCNLNATSSPHAWVQTSERLKSLTRLAIVSLAWSNSLEDY